MSSMTAAVAVSSRMTATDVPCIVQMQQMLRGKSDVFSLAQGIVHWAPPDDGLPALREALKAKLKAENGIRHSEVMVTAGANQAYTNVVLTLMDATDAAMLFRPYYFNHLMALQMTGSAAEVILPPSTADLLPDIEQLRAELTARAADGRRQVRDAAPGQPDWLGDPAG